MWSSTDRRMSRAAGLLLTCSLLLATIGCMRRGPERFRVHGTVTHGGKPVPLGRIVFEPDLSRGNRGPQGFAAIEHGRFDTAAAFCRGSVGGPMVVRIDGFERVGGAEDAATAGRQLFDTFEMSLVLPRESVRHDFVVPAHAAR